MSGPPLLKDLPPAPQAPVPIQEPRQLVDLARCTPYAVSPKVPSFQLELSICPRHDVPVYKLSFETSLNTFKVSRDPKTNSLSFPFISFVPEGESTDGLRLIVDNSTSPNSDLGAHTRVSWTVDTTSISRETGAVALALSSDDFARMRMVALTMFQTQIDPRTGRIERQRVLAKTALMHSLMKQRCSDQNSGTLVLAILSRSEAWWHMHMPLAYAQQPRARQFSTGACRPKTWGQEAPITGTLASIQQRGGYGYPSFRNITVSVERVRGLSVAKVLEKLTCGSVGTYARPSLRIIDTLTGQLKGPHPREYHTKRTERNGGAEWSDEERVSLGLSLYHVHAASTDVVRINLYSGSRYECDSSASADDAAADQQGGVDGKYQFRDVPVAELWQLLPQGMQDSQCSVELRMKGGPHAKSGDRLATIVVRVAIQADPQQ